MKHTIPAVGAAAETAFREGLAQHRQGQLAAASALYERALQLWPEHSQAWHLLGVIAYQSDQPARAAELIGKATALEPHHAAAHVNLGNAQLQLRQFEAAVASYDAALALDSDLVDALYNRANALGEMRRYERAIEDYDRAITLRPDHIAALNNRGLAQAAIKQPLAAIASYEAALARSPTVAQLWNNRGTALHDLGRYEAAIESFDRAIALNPQFAAAYNNRGFTLLRVRRFDAALESCEQALALAGDFAEAYTNRGSALRSLERFDEALASYDRAILLRKDRPEAHNNRGIVLRDLGQLDLALESYDRAIALNPAYAESYSNRGIALHDLRRLPAALEHFDRAIALEPGYAQARFNRAVTCLLRGEYVEGWREFEWRWGTESLEGERRDFEQPLWLGQEPLNGKTVLLHCEQGLGDTLQFCRYATLVAARGAHVLLEVQAPLARLLARLEGVERVLKRGDPLPPFDLHCPLMSLPLAFGTTLATVPAARTYLSFPEEQVGRWQAQLGEPRKLRVGIVWAGGLRPDQPEVSSANHRRNVPLGLIAGWAHEGIEFYSLQKGAAAESELSQAIARGWGGPRLIDVSHRLQDFSDTAALMSHLDLVITVDTSTAHLAGALGIPVWILCPHAHCWRWLLNRTDSPWYPTAKLYRQERAGDWEPVVRTVRGDLFELATAARPSRAEHA